MEFDLKNSKQAALDIVVSEDAAVLHEQPLLTLLYFGNSTSQHEDCLSIQTELELLGSNLFAQYWFTDQQVLQDRYQNIRYAYTPQMLFGFIELDCLSEINLQALTQQAYSEIFNCLEHTSCKHLLRTWNFFPGITAADPLQPKLNHYETFCRGRLQAMQACHDKKFHNGLV